MQEYEFVIEDNRLNSRLDVFLTESLPDFSRSYLKKLIDDSLVTVNGQCSKPNYKLKLGDSIEMAVPDLIPLDVKPEPIALTIVYEDEWILVIDKPAGMVVHPAPGNHTGTLVNAVLNHCSDLSGIGGVERPGIVHRLDKDTSGVIIVAKNDKSLQSLAKQFKDRVVKKQYLALAKGVVRNHSGIIDASIGRHRVNRKKMAVDKDFGREAITRYETIEKFDRFTFLKLFPKTGRTHQIRVHLSHIGNPVLGDKLYNGTSAHPEFKSLARQALHAHILELRHPHSGDPVRFESSLPKDIASLMNK
jgi:23S rRNA pseudouridine1911/1915/1917 synthase